MDAVFGGVFFNLIPIGHGVALHLALIFGGGVFALLAQTVEIAARNAQRQDADNQHHAQHDAGAHGKFACAGLGGGLFAWRGRQRRSLLGGRVTVAAAVARCRRGGLYVTQNNFSFAYCAAAPARGGWCCGNCPTYRSHGRRGGASRPAAAGLPCGAVPVGGKADPDA